MIIGPGRRLAGRLAGLAYYTSSHQVHVVYTKGNLHNNLDLTLLEMKQAVENAGGALPEEEARCWEAVYDELLANGRQELEERCRQGKHEGARNAQNFIQRLEKRKQEALLFLRKKEVPFDNNQAERDLRMVKVKQKISGTFRQEDDAKAFCAMRSVISTLQKQGKPVWESLQKLLSGESLQTILHSS
ncbi:transposase [Geobacillus sp. G4]